MKSNFFIKKKAYSKNRKNYIQRKPNSTPQHFCVAEDILLLKGGVLYGFTGPKIKNKKNKVKFSNPAHLIFRK